MSLDTRYEVLELNIETQEIISASEHTDVNAVIANMERQFEPSVPYADLEPAIERSTPSSVAALGRFAYRNAEEPDEKEEIDYPLVGDFMD